MQSRSINVRCPRPPRTGAARCAPHTPTSYGRCALRAALAHHVRAQRAAPHTRNPQSTGAARCAPHTPPSIYGRSVLRPTHAPLNLRALRAALAHHVRAQRAAPHTRPPQSTGAARCAPHTPPSIYGRCALRPTHAPLNLRVLRAAPHTRPLNLRALRAALAHLVRAQRAALAHLVRAQRAAPHTRTPQFPPLVPKASSAARAASCAEDCLLLPMPLPSCCSPANTQVVKVRR